MLQFSQFLVETALVGTVGPEHQHYQKYIAPHFTDPENAPEITLDKDVGPHKAGSRIYPIQGTTRSEKGKYSTEFRIGDPKKGKKVLLPHNYIRKPESGKTGTYVDENAVIRMGNHGMQNLRGRDFSVEDLHNEIEKARTDPTHHLHHLNVPDSEFVGKKRNEKSEESYYNQLKDASHTIHALKNHPDFADHFKNGDVMEGSGRLRPELSDLYRNEGVKGAGATSKADVISIRSRDPQHKAVKLLSLKQGGGSQFMSSRPSEFSAIYKQAFNNLHQRGEINDEQHAQAHAHIDKIKQYLNKGDISTSKKLLQQLHDNHENTSLTREINREALTGDGKFKTAEGTATHVATIGKDAHVDRIDDFLDRHDNYLNDPIITKGKGGVKSNPPVVRLVAPYVPVKERESVQNIKPAWMSKTKSRKQTQTTSQVEQPIKRVDPGGFGQYRGEGPDIGKWPKHMHQAHVDGTHGGMKF